jgi:hypothetical protein
MTAETVAVKVMLLPAGAGFWLPAMVVCEGALPTVSGSSLPARGVV